jgi:hypothetical protein
MLAELSYYASMDYVDDDQWETLERAMQNGGPEATVLASGKRLPLPRVDTYFAPFRHSTEPRRQCQRPHRIIIRVTISGHFDWYRVLEYLLSKMNQNDPIVAHLHE